MDAANGALQVRSMRRIVALGLAPMGGEWVPRSRLMKAHGLLRHARKWRLGAEVTQIKIVAKHARAQEKTEKKSKAAAKEIQEGEASAKRCKSVQERSAETEQEWGEKLPKLRAELPKAEHRLKIAEYNRREYMRAYSRQSKELNEIKAMREKELADLKAEVQRGDRELSAARYRDRLAGERLAKLKVALPKKRKELAKAEAVAQEARAAGAQARMALSKLEAQSAAAISKVDGVVATHLEAQQEKAERLRKKADESH